MKIQLNLPSDVLKRLLDEVSQGRHTSIEQAILERLSRSENSDLLGLMRGDAAWLRHDLDSAWADRADAVDGDSFFSQLADRSASLKAQGK